MSNAFTAQAAAVADEAHDEHARDAQPEREAPVGPIFVATRISKDEARLLDRFAEHLSRGSAADKTGAPRRKPTRADALRALIRGLRRRPAVVGA